MTTWTQPTFKADPEPEPRFEQPPEPCEHDHTADVRRLCDPGPRLICVDCGVHIEDDE